MAPAVRAAGLPGKWVEVRTPNFVVVSNDGTRSAKKTAEHFEQIREMFIRVLPARAAKTRSLRVLAVNGERTMKLLRPEIFAQKGRAQVSGFFRLTPLGSQVVVRADLLDGNGYGTVYHEYFHYLAHGTGTGLPVWINEGFASYWANTRLTAKVAEVGRPDGFKLRILRAGSFLPLEELMAVDHSSPHYTGRYQAAQFYSQSWALIHYLLLGDKSGQGRAQLIDYLRRIGEGESSSEAAPKAFGDLDDLKGRLRSYTRKPVLPYAKMEPPPPLPKERFKVREMSLGEASALVALFSLEERRTQGVEEWVAAALEGAPRLAATQLAAGLLHVFRSEYDLAEQALERAVGLADASALAFSSFSAVRGYQDPTPAGLASAEENMARALALDPEFGPAMAGLAEIYRRRGDCSERTLALIRSAHAKQPRYSRYGLKEAQILLECERADEALVIARRLVEEAADSESAAENNQLCWSGSLWGLASEMLPACDRAVELAPESYAIRDSRGIARALAGDLKGAAADLRAAVNMAGKDGWTEDGKARRTTMAERLEAGENPLAGDGLITFRDDPKESGLLWWM